MKNLFSKFRRALPLLALLFMLPTAVWGAEETLASFSNSSNSGWTISGNPSYSNAGGYQLVASNMSITSPVIDFTKYKDLKITITCRKYNGPNTTQGKISVKQGTTSGTELATYSPGGTSLKSSGAISIAPTSKSALVIYCPGASSSKGCGISEIVIKGTQNGSQVDCPENLNAGTPNSTGTTLSWDAVDHATAYKVEYKVSTASSWTVVTPNPETNSCTLSGLTPSTTYAWQVTALSTEDGYTDGSAASGTNFTTAAPANHKAYFSINGTIQNPEGTEFMEGAAITFPSVGDQGDKKFMGWTETSNYTGVDAPTDLCTSATMGGDDVTFYAVYATASGSTSEPESKNPSFSLGTTMPTGWTTDADNKASGYIRLKDGQYAQVDVVKASIIPEDKILASDNMSVVVSVGTYGTWTGTTKSVKIIVSLLDKEENVLSSNNATFSSLTSSESAVKDAIRVSKPSDPSKIKYLRVTASDHTGGSEIRLKYVKPTYSITDDITYSDYTTKVRAVDHIKVTTAPTKKLYKVGEPLDLTDMVVTAYYDAEETDSRLLSSGYTVTPDATLTTADKNITVTLNADNTKTATTPIDVVALDKIVATGAKDTYFETQDFDLTNLVVTATWGTEEGKKIEEEVTESATISGDKNLQSGTTSVRISYTHEGTTKTFDYAITVSQSSEKALTRLTMSNGFKPFITSTDLVAYYIQGSEVPTINESSIVVSPYATKRVDGNSIIVTAQDGTEATYTVTTTEVAPLMTSTNAATTFDGTESAWIKSGYGWSADKGWKISKNLDKDNNSDESRIIEGKNRLYFYVGPALEFKLINGLIGTNRDVIVTVNGVVQPDLNKIIANSRDNGPSVMTLTGLSNQTNNVICIESNNNGGDGGFSAYELTIAPRYTVSFKYTDGTEAHEDICQETYDANITLPNLTVAEGKLFKGWSTSATPSSADAGAAGETYKPTANTPLYAYIVDVYAVTFNGTVEHGSFKVKNGDTEITSGNKFEANTTLTVVCNPNKNYHVSSVTKNGTEILYADNKYSFTMPAEAVTVAVTFAEDEQYHISWMVNGKEAKYEDVYSDIAISAPTVDAPQGKVFRGWSYSHIDGVSNNAPEFVNVTNLMVSEAKTLYAVFATEVEGSDFVLVEALNKIHEGEAYIGSYINYSGSRYYVATSATDLVNATVTNKVLSIPANAIKLTFVSTGTANEFYIKNGSGNYLNVTSSDWASFTSTACALTFSGSSPFVLKTSSGNNYLRAYGSSSTAGKLKRYASQTNTGICVFQKSVEYSAFCTSVITTPVPGAGNWSTLCLDYNYTISNATAYIATSVDIAGNTIELTPLAENTIIPARAGIAIQATANYTITPTTSAAAELSDNQFEGFFVRTLKDTNFDWYGISTKDGVTGFAKAGAGVTHLPAGKAFLKVAAGGSAPARLDMTVLDRPSSPITTDVEAVNKYVDTKKMLVRGQLVIVRGNKMFDMNGRLVK